jgi:hypothetical protein
MFKITGTKKLLFGFSAFLLSLFYIVNVVSATGDSESSTTLVYVPNVAPEFTQDPYEEPASGSSTPISKGDSIEIKATAEDANLDDYYLAICKSDMILAVDSQQPYCTAGEWCMSDKTKSGEETGCSYQSQSNDNSESNPWFAFVCDAVERDSQCSTAKQGVDISGSPFYVEQEAYINNCGNNKLDFGEECDGELITKSCVDYGFAFGNTICTQYCTIDISECVYVEDVVDTQNIQEFLEELYDGISIDLPSPFKELVLVETTAISIGALWFSALFAFPGLITKKEKKPWGIVYDLSDRSPIAFATLRLLQNQELIAQKVSDLEGRYSFSVETGFYDIEVRHNSYKPFDARIKLEKESDKENRDIALEKLTQKGLNIRGRLRDYLAKARETFPKLSLYFFVIGFTFTVIATLITPANFVVLLIYVTIGIIYIIRYFLDIRNSGLVFDSKTRQPIPYAKLILFSEEEERVVDNKFANIKGKYNFILDPGMYYIYVTAPGYKFPSESEKRSKVDLYIGKAIKVEAKKGEPISLNFALDPIEGEEQSDTITTSQFGAI